MTEAKNDDKIKLQGLEAAARLLDRKPDPSYIDKWTKILAQRTEKFDVQGISVVIFRLGDEWLAINAKAFCRVIESRKIHSIPQKSQQGLLGVVNFEGRLTLCINMHEHLGARDHEIAHLSPTNQDHLKYRRMLAIQDQNEQWVFVADEIFGLFKCHENSIKNVPVSLVKSSKNYLKGVFEWENKSCGLLDEELLFFSLRRSLL